MFGYGYIRLQMSSAHMTDVIRCVSACGNYMRKVKVWRRINADLLQNGIKVILPNGVKDDRPRRLLEPLRLALSFGQPPCDIDRKRKTPVHPVFDA